MKTRYKIVERKATPYGGLYAVSEFLDQIRFPALFHKVFGKYRKVRKYHPWENISMIVATILSGGERLYDVERLASDPVLPDLFGNGIVPQDTTLRDDLKHIGKMNDQRQEMLFLLNEMLFKHQNIKKITIDVDGTALPVDGYQEGAEVGYCPADQGSRCLQSLSAVCDETETVLAEETRSGNTHCANDVIPFIRRILDRFAPKMPHIVIRLDKGFFSDDLLTMLEEYPNVIYEVAVPQHEPLRNRVRRLGYKSYHGSEREYARISRTGGRYYYVERTRKPPQTQLDLLEPDACTYRVIACNDSARQPHSLFRDYNGRGRDEQQICELKNEYALGKMVSGDFDVTKALCWVCHLAYTLTGMFRQIALRHELAKHRLRRLRFILFTTVAYWTNHSRQRILNLCSPLIGEMRLKFLLRRVWAY